MAVTTPFPYQWRLAEFVLAWEAGAFQDRVELIDGAVWSVPIGQWHGDTSGRVLRALPNKQFTVTTSSLPAGASLPDPDCWVHRAEATPLGQVSRRLPRWSATDVLLVVEVSDETLEHDLGRKAALYATAGYPHYWSVTRLGVYHHSDPGRDDYGQRRLFGRGTQLPVPHAPDILLDVDELIGSE